MKGAKSDSGAANAVIPLVHGEPIRFGTPGEDGLGTRGVVRDPATGGVRVVELTDDSGHTADSLLVHDAHASDPTTAFALSRLTDAGYLHQAPIGIFRQIERTTYDDAAREQVRLAAQSLEDPHTALEQLMHGSDTWSVV
jgi:2-oxoglutarate ferredoxin oxidoreductase subunit beta